MAAQVYVLDVGHGNCAVAIGDNWTVLVDAAPSAVVLAALDYLGVRRLDRIVISHRDADHASGVASVLAREDLSIDTIFISADAAKDPRAPETALLLAALSDAKRAGRCVVSRDLDNALPTGVLNGGGMVLEVVAPTFAAAMTGPTGNSPVGRRMTSNTVSAVVRIELPDRTRVLLPGDIDEVAFAELRETGADLTADVLVFPHHGAHSAVKDEGAFAAQLVEAVRPRSVVFSVSRTRQIRPSENVIRGILDVDPTIEIACTQLSRGCLPDDTGLPASSSTLSHLTTVPGAGAARCRSCAGSVTVGAGGLLGPLREAYDEYIAAVATQPMCRRLRPASAPERSPVADA